MKIFLFKLAASCAIGLGVALFAGCATSPTESLACAFSPEECGDIPGFQNITVNVAGEGGGHGVVTSSSSAVGINCQIATNTTGQVVEVGDCSDTFQDAGLGGGFSLTATPLEGYQFGGWSGDCTGSDPVCGLTFSTGPDVTFNVIARFYPIVAS